MFARKTIVLFFALLVWLKAEAISKAYLDSVLNVFKTTSVTKDKMFALYVLSYEYGMIEPRVGIQYGNQCLKMAMAENDLIFQLNGYNGIANAYETLSKFDSAKYFHKLSFDVAQKTKIPMKIGLTLTNMALCSKQLGDYRTALDEFLAGYRLLEKEQAYNPRIHFYMSELYMRTGDYREAEFHARKGIRKCEEYNHNHVLLSMHVNLAKCYLQRNKIDSALVLLHDALEKFKVHTDNVGIALCLNAIGEMYTLKGDFAKAKRYFEEELVFQKGTGNQNGILIAYVNLANITAHLKPVNTALVNSFLKASFAVAPTIKANADILLQWYNKLAVTQELTGDVKGALRSQKRYFQVYDSLMNREKVHQLLELQTKYETEKKENHIKLLEQNDRLKSLELQAKEQQISKRNYFILFSVLLFGLLGILVYLFVQKQKQKAVFERDLAVKVTEEKERIRMAKDIHDDLGSGLSKINYLSELIAGNTSLNNDVKDTTRSISETAQKLIVNMRDLIWALDPGNVTLDGLVSRIREFSSEYFDDYPASLSMEIDDTMPDLPITKEAYRSILMTVKESLNNIVKHAKAHHVSIEITLFKDELRITVSDDGIGFQKTNGSGNGLRNMRSRIESIGGTFLIECTQGTHIVITIPSHKLAQP